MDSACFFEVALVNPRDRVSQGQEKTARHERSSTSEVVSPYKKDMEDSLAVHQ